MTPECRNGHPRTPATIYARPDTGTVSCRACRTRTTNKSRRKRRAEKRAQGSSQ